jgi:hypothetical protein
MSKQGVKFSKGPFWERNRGNTNLTLIKLIFSGCLISFL